MKSEPSITKEEAGRPAAENWGPFVTLIATGGIVALTLFPFQLLPKETMLHRQPPFLLWYMEKAFEWKDWLLNVALFVPFGFGLGMALRRRYSNGAALLIATAGSFAFTFTIETLQVFMPTRTSSWYDVSANTCGGILGFLIALGFRVWAEEMLSDARDCLARGVRGKSMAGVFTGLAILGVAGSAWLGRGATLSNWDPTYPLVIGNMPNGGASWQGRVREIGISSKALAAGDEERVFSEGFSNVTGKSLLTLYKPGSLGDRQDLAGISPPLDWKPNNPAPQGSEASFKMNGPWLESRSAAAQVAERIRETNQFSVYADFDADPAYQPGVLPIIGMCRDEDHCNFLLAHYYLSLVFRVRTPITGESAARSDYHQRQLLSLATEHRVLVTYDGATLRFFADGTEAGPAMELGPGPQLFRHFHPIGQYQEAGYRIIYYAVLFGPLGILIWLRRLGGSSIQWLWTVGATAFVAVVLEAVLTVTCRRPFQAMNIVLGLAWFAGTYWFFTRTIPQAKPQS